MYPESGWTVKKKKRYTSLTVYRLQSSTSNNYRSTFEVSKEFSIAISKKGDFCTPFHSLNCHMNAGEKSGYACLVVKMNTCV